MQLIIVQIKLKMKIRFANSSYSNAIPFHEKKEKTFLKPDRSLDKNS